MRSSLKGLFDLLPTTFRQLIPLNGIFWQEWQPTTAIAIYWLESFLLAGAAVALCWRLERRTSDAAIAAARADEGPAAVAALTAERQQAAAAGVNPGDVLLFHGSSLAVFGVFLALLMLILSSKGHLAPFDWREFRNAAVAMGAVVAVGVVGDLLLFRSMSIAAVQSRVNSCTARWALLWLLGFVGTLLLLFTGRPGAFIGLFAILKAVWETWALLARRFGWTSLKERAEC